LLDEVQAKVSVIPEERRVRVYHAEGMNSLSTDLIGLDNREISMTYDKFSGKGEIVRYSGS
jgi:hypothetical protein